MRISPPPDRGRSGYEISGLYKRSHRVKAGPFEFGAIQGKICSAQELDKEVHSRNNTKY